MSDLPNTMAALYLGEVSTASTEKEDVWAPQPVWISETSEESLVHVENQMIPQVSSL